MKLASLRDGSRDGQLVVVSRDLSRCCAVPDVAPNLQHALDDWETLYPRLEAVYRDLNENNKTVGKDFVQADCCAPLPRAYQWADASAYVNHVELVRKARGAAMPESFWSDPLIYQGGSDAFLGPRDDILVESDSWGVDFEAEIAVITGDLPMGASTDQASREIRLLMLVNDVSLRALIPAELAKGFGFFQSKPSSAFSPVCVTPDELGSAWRDGKVNLPLLVRYNDRPFGRPNAGQDMTFSFPEILAHAAKTRPLSVGSIVGSGTVSNKMADGPGKPIEAGGLGYSCIAEMRMIETIDSGAPRTRFMTFGDRVQIEMKTETGQSVFGTIDQTVTAYKPKLR